MSATEIADSITASIEIDAPIETVWALVSEPGRWINDGELEQHEITTAPAPGGGVLAEVGGTSAGSWQVLVVELREHAYAAFRWAPHTAVGHEVTAEAGSTLVEFTLTPRHGKVVVEMTESGFTALPLSRDRIIANYNDNVEGWTEELQVLGRNAEVGSIQ
jgi:uncharacterized protein YndB with AHSA1/START domain